MRRPDWPERLAAMVAAAEARPFRWGTHDCVLWACDVVREMTGLDPVSDIRGRYADLRGALTCVGEIGADLRAAVTARCAALGYASIPPALAQRGDLVLVPSGVPAWPECLGICLGRTAATTGTAALVGMPMTRALAAWRVE